ncbi:MAG: class I SAM-dependent DNA methyltransferase, partial [Chromatiaceae bacterium]
MNNFSEKVSFIWGVADLLRGDYKQSEYGRVILPFIVLRRLDQVLSPSRGAVWEADARSRHLPEALREKMLMKAAGCGFYNVSRLDFPKLLADPDNVAANLTGFLHGFSANVRDIMERFRFEVQITRLDNANLLFLVARKFVEIDLHPFQSNPDGSVHMGADGQPEPNVTNHEMGYIFEELIRRFSEQSNETAGEHFTPREVIRFMVNLLFAEDGEALHQPGVVRKMYDPACGTGGMLSVAEDYLARLNPEARLQVYGQELNDESYAICKADMLVKGQAADNIKCGNSFSADGLPGLKADYLISNPPFGVDWSKAERAVRDEHEHRGFAGRFGPGLPRKNDGSLLFLLHMLSKMKPVDPKTGEGGSRLAIVFNGSPLFTGSADSGESNIRRWIIENDWLEAIVAL